MKSLIYTAALLPLGALAWGGKPSDVDEVVIVTSTRTVTVCPITDYWTCASDDPATTWSDWEGSSPTGGVSTTGSPATTSGGYGGGDDGGDGGHGGHGGGPGGDGSSTTPVGPATTTSGWSGGGGDGGDGGDGGHGGSGTTTPTSPTGTTSGSWSYSYSNGGSSSWTGPNGGSSSYPSGGSSSWSASTSSGPYNSYTTSASYTTTSAYTTTTSTTSCAPSVTISALPESVSCTDNTASDRSKWCGKSVGDDTNDAYTSGNTKTFALTITSAESNFDGTLRPAFLINGGTPGPVIEANYGDWVEVTVTNLLTDNATTIHWHGIRQLGTNDQDGVPGVTECAIPPLGSRTYKWLASTYGTGWYHSHALSQYGGGIRGPVIIHGPSTANYDYDSGTVMVDEVFGQTIFQMAYNIARIRGPLPAAVNYLLNGGNKAIDGSAGKSTEWTVAPGKKHLFRIINSSAQAAYIVHFDNHKLTVISADYTPIVPYETDSLYISPGQRYNVIVEMDQTPGAYFLRAITQTGCGIANLNDGTGSIANGIFTYKGSCGTPVTDSTVAALAASVANDCKDEVISNLVPYVSKNGGSQDLFTASAALLPAGNAAQQSFDGYGPVARWYFGPTADLSTNSPAALGSNSITVDYDNPTLKNIATLPSVSFNNSIYTNNIVLDGPAGEWVYFVIQNNFVTSHPIHLHGHDFSVLGQGKGIFTADQAGSLNFGNPIRRDTALLFGIAGAGGAPQGGWTVIGFETDNPGAWVMHCHIIWHADGGMALQYIEQPASIPASTYWNSASFQNECSAYDAYKAAGGIDHINYESGIKRGLERHAAHEKRHAHHAVH